MSYTQTQLPPPSPLTFRFPWLVLHAPHPWRWQLEEPAERVPRGSGTQDQGRSHVDAARHTAASGGDGVRGQGQGRAAVRGLGQYNRKGSVLRVCTQSDATPAGRMLRSEHGEGWHGATGGRGCVRVGRRRKGLSDRADDAREAQGSGPRYRSSSRGRIRWRVAPSMTAAGPDATVAGPRRGEEG